MAGFFVKPSFCCCGCPLKEGTVALVCINMIFHTLLSFILAIYLSPTGAVWLLIPFCIFSCNFFGIYGIRLEVPALLIPPIIIQGIITFICGILVLVLISDGHAALISFHNIISDSPADAMDVATVTSDLIIAMAVCLLNFGIQYHFFAVLLSCYYQIKKKMYVPLQV